MRRISSSPDKLVFGFEPASKKRSARSLLPMLQGKVRKSRPDGGRLNLNSRVTGSSAGACGLAARCADPVADDDGGEMYAPRSHRRHRRNVFAVFRRQDDAGTIVEAVAILFGEIIDSLTCRDVLLGEQRLADGLAKLRGWR